MGAGKISIGSPVALALLRAQRGQEVAVRTPRGMEVLEIIDIPLSKSRYPRSQGLMA
jgi:transcription elongation GreA/GreB family factor